MKRLAWSQRLMLNLRCLTHCEAALERAITWAASAAMSPEAGGPRANRRGMTGGFHASLSTHRLSAAAADWRAANTGAASVAGMFPSWQACNTHYTNVHRLLYT